MCAGEGSSAPVALDDGWWLHSYELEIMQNEVAVA
jgi:hypothetical protein